MFKDKKKIFIVIVALILFLTIGVTYSYFSAILDDTGGYNNVITSTGTLKLLYTDGPEIVAENIKPGWIGTKTFTVENTGSLNTTYSIRMIDIHNTIQNDEMHISYYSTPGGAGMIDREVCSSDCSLSQNIMISTGETHTYTVNFEFIEVNANQNYNQGKSFSAMLNVIGGNDTTMLSFNNLENIMVESAKTYVDTNDIVEDTYLPIKTLGITYDEFDYFTSSTGVEVDFDNSVASYTPYISAENGKNTYSNNIRTVSSNVVLLGASTYTMKDKYVEPGYIVEDGYMVVAKNTNELVDGKNTLLYNVYRGNRLVDTLSRIVYKDSSYTDYSLSCEGEIDEGVTTLSITSANPIHEYSVYSNNSFVGNSSNNTFTINEESLNAYINFKDQSGNSYQQQCYITNKEFPLEVHMIDVGGGGEDALVIRNDRSTIVIDGGTYETGVDETDKYLKALGVTNVDLLIGSHLDYNHVQAHSSIINNYGVETIMYNSNIKTCITDDYCEESATEYIVPTLNERNITPMIGETGDEIYLDGFRMKIYAPNGLRTKTEDSSAENKNSFNIMLTYKNKKFFFTGDHISESRLLSNYDEEEFDIDFLKHPHHGNINIENAFIQTMSPEIDFISAGSDYLTEYFSSDKTALEDVGTSIYQTFSSNNLVAISDGNTITAYEHVYPSVYNRNEAHSNTIKNAQTFITNYQTIGLTKIDHEATESQNYATTDYRFQGSNPNNYILFNNNQLWRIIGVHEVEDGTGSESKSYRIKIISEEDYLLPFDTNDINSFATSSLAGILNTGDYYNKLNDFAVDGLSNVAKTQIGDTLWYLGGLSGNGKPAEEIYENERSDRVYGGSSTTYTGKVAILYASDYAYANDRCYLMDSDEENIGNEYCRNNNWMYEKKFKFTLAPYYYGSDNNAGIRTSGHISYTSTNGDSTYINPVVYLKSNIDLVGSGTVVDPYRIK